MTFADRKLVQRVESAWDWISVENVIALARLAPESGAEVFEVGGAHAAYLGVGSPLSQIQGLGLNGPVSEDELSRLEKFFHERGGETRIEVASLADPTFLSMLCRRGYQILEQTHMLVRPLEKRETPGPTHGHSDKTVEILQVGPEGIENWVDVIIACFFEGPDAPPPALRQGGIAMAMARDITCWLARIDGRTAGAGTLAIHDGLALMCGDGTLPDSRQRGVQSALLRTRLDHAVAKGCDLAVICTEPGSGSQRNAERLGFRVAYARTMMCHP